MRKRPGFLTSADIEFLVRTFVFSLMVLAFLHAFSPYISDSKAATRAEVEELARQTRLITPEEVVLHLRQAQRPTMLVVYASWCQYCKRLMPSVAELWAAGKMPGDQMLLISLDQQFYPLAEYLLNNHFQRMLGTPVIVQQAHKAALGEALQPLGAHFTGGIPYIAFFDASGHLREEIHGLVDKSTLENALENIR